MLLANKPFLIMREVFFALLRAGLWEHSVLLSSNDSIDFGKVYLLAEEQSVVGLIAAGLEQVENRKIVKQEALPFLKKVYSVEGRNVSMNLFIADLFYKLLNNGVYGVLIKGQGVGQCYARPQWRSAGDIDLFFDNYNYQKAKSLLTSLASSVENEDVSRLHLGMTIDNWVVELHGTMHTGISERVNRVIDIVQCDIFQNTGVRVWHDGKVIVPLPKPDNDVIIIFTHFIEHFYVGGIGLRQICDWCRLLWIYRDTIDRELLESRLKEMRLMTEWRAFGALAVDWLGMPEGAIPLLVSTVGYKRKARRLIDLIMETGNFGHNKDESYRTRYPKLVGKSITFWRRLGEFTRLSTIFPTNAPRFFVTYVMRRTKAAL